MSVHCNKRRGSICCCKQQQKQAWFDHVLRFFMYIIIISKLYEFFHLPGNTKVLIVFYLSSFHYTYVSRNLLRVRNSFFEVFQAAGQAVTSVQIWTRQDFSQWPLHWQPDEPTYSFKESRPGTDRSYASGMGKARKARVFC